MTHPYRVEETGAEPPDELLYAPRDNDRLLPTPVRVGLGASAAGTIALAAGAHVIGAAAIGAGAAFALWRWWRTPGAAGIVFRVERGGVKVIDRATKKTLVDARLVTLLDIAMDTKSIRKVMPGKDAIPAVQFINTSVGPELDVARIVVHLADDQVPVKLGERFIPHMDAVEWVGKIRSFLRRHGWVPVDEREAPPSEE